MMFVGMYTRIMITVVVYGAKLQLLPVVQEYRSNMTYTHCPN